MPGSLRARETNDSNLAVVLTGGGARAAYQVGILRHLAARYPDLAPGILIGVSAGAMITMHLASRRGRFAESVARLAEIWQNLRIGDVCRVDSVDLASRVTRWGLRLLSGGTRETQRARSLVDSEPLRHLLTRTLEAGSDGRLDRITRNLQAGILRAVALTASSYITGQSVTWVQSRDRFGALMGDGARREGIDDSLRVDHVMASGALPFIFPPVAVGDGWYGDGGIRLTAPLSPAIHLGARKIIAVSTRHPRSGDEMRRPSVTGDRPPAQVAGTLLNAIFLDLLDADVLRLQQVNSLIDRLPPGARGDLHHVDVLVLRPSQDLGRLANDFEADLPRSFQFLFRGSGSRETRSNDLLSLLMFQPDYTSRLIELGEADARRQAVEIEGFLGPGLRPRLPRKRPDGIATAPETSLAGFAQGRQNARLDTAAVPVLAS
jgi:NTE family protein